MLTEDEVTTIVRDLWTQHREELPDHDRVYRFIRGEAGVPDVPDSATQELKDLAKLSVKNVLTLVRDGFTMPLRIVGIRSPDAAENDDAAWALWQEQKLDARQKEAYRSAVTYGTAYAVVSAEGIRFRSPRQLFAVYGDAEVDAWPVYALETWIDRRGKKPLRRGLLFDDTHEYPVNLGALSRQADKAEQMGTTQRRITVTLDEDYEPTAHRFGHPPVVRFVNDHDAEDLVEGEIAPLISDQKAINAVNFDRMVVSRFGAFPQKYVIGWAPTKNELVQASVQNMLAIDEDAKDVSVGTFQAASVEGYNQILEEQLVHVAMKAGLAPFGITGSFANLAADTIAQIAKPYQDKLGAKQDSFGEAMEQTIRAYASIQGVTVADDAEVVWDETEARSFAQVVDGITKLQVAGAPIEDLIEDVPGWSQQRVSMIRTSIRRTRAMTMMAGLSIPAQDPEPEP